MPPPWTVLFALAGAAPQTIALHERSSVVLLDVRGALPSETFERLREAGDRWLAKDTSLELIAPAMADLDRAAFIRCAGAERFTCWSQLARSARRDVRFVWIIAASSTDGGHDVRSVWLDVARAGEAPSADANRENWIFENAVRELPPEPLADVDRFVATMFGTHVRDTIEDADAWRPYGAIAIAAGDAGLVIELDGRTIGTTVAAPTRIEGIRRGRHTLNVHDGRAVAFSGAVDAADEPTPIVLAPAGEDPTRVGIVNRVAMYSGFAIAATGVALLAVAAASSPSAPAGVCSGPGCPPASTGGWITSCQLGGADAACVADPSGVLVPGLGLALFGAGASFGLGALLFESDRDVPWWSLAIGVATGIAVYGLSALLAYPEGV